MDTVQHLDEAICILTQKGWSFERTEYTIYDTYYATATHPREGRVVGRGSSAILAELQMVGACLTERSA